MSTIINIIKKLRSTNLQEIVWRNKSNKHINILNTINLKSENEGIILCEGFWDNPLHWLRITMLRQALADDYGYKLLGLYKESVRSETLSSLRSLKLFYEECISEKIHEQYVEKAREMLKSINNNKDIYYMKFPDGYPSCYFYDEVLKREKCGEVDLINHNIEYYLAQLLQYADDFENIIQKYNITAAIISHDVTSIYSMLAWKLINNNIPVFRAIHYNGHSNIKKILKREQMLKVYEDSPTPEIFSQLSDPSRKKLIQLGDNYLSKLTEGRESSISLIKVYGNGKSVYDSKVEFVESIGCDADKPLHVILGSSWYDFPNGYGYTYFTDYLDWFKITYNAVKNIKNCNWVLRPHPAEKIYYSKKFTMKLVVDKISDYQLPEHIYWWPDDATAVEVSNFSDCIVTPRGTSAIEHTAAGIKTIVASENPYTPFKFVNFATNKDEYLDLLINSTKLNPPTIKQRNNAKMFAASFLADFDKKGILRFPYADGQSSKLYKIIPEFIKNNSNEINKEISFLKEWINSEYLGFNTFKMFNEKSGLLYHL